MRVLDMVHSLAFLYMYMVLYMYKHITVWAAVQ